MPARPCLECGTPTTRKPARCDHCERQHQHERNARRTHYQAEWPRLAKQAIANHRAQYGDTCPGWGRAPHPTAPRDWTCDHELGPLCRSCNSRKGAAHDRPRKASKGP